MISIRDALALLDGWCTSVGHRVKPKHNDHQLNRDFKHMKREAIDEDLSSAIDLAVWGLNEAQAANDLLSLLVGAIVKTQPAVASELRRSLKVLLESEKYILEEEFANNARRLCLVLDGEDRDWLDSVYPGTRLKDLKSLRLRVISMRNGDDPDKK